MDKFYMKSKKTTEEEDGTNNRNHSFGNATAKCLRHSLQQYSQSGRSLGMGRIYTKIRHKIEDNFTPKFSGKLSKIGKHSLSMGALSTIGGGRASTIPRKDVSSKPIDHCLVKDSNQYADDTKSLYSSAYAMCYNTDDVPKQMDTAKQYNNDKDDYDDDDPLWMHLMATSLEDEIFQELEKVTQDELQLNAVLKSYDKILVDYSKSTASYCDSANNNKPETQNESNTTMTNTTFEEIERTPQSEVDSGIVANSQSFSEGMETIEKSPQSLPLTLEKSKSGNSVSKRIPKPRNRSKSVWELNPTSKIPVLKTLPIQNRSHSFCYTANIKEKKMGNSVNNKISTTSMHQTKVQRFVETTLPSNKSNLMLSSSSLNNNLRLKKSICQLEKNTFINGRAAGDILLDKCLEKGKQILHKVETLSTQPAQSLPQNKKPMMQTNKLETKITNSPHQKVKIEDIYAKVDKKAKILHANDVKVDNLESEIIASNAIMSTCNASPNLSDSKVNILTNDDVKPYEVKHIIDKYMDQDTDNDSNDSGHISNENQTENEHLSDALHAISSSTASWTSSLIESSPESLEGLTANNVNVDEKMKSSNIWNSDGMCTSCKVANVDAVQLVRTHLEIYPNYSKELLFRSGALNELEARRDELLSDRITQLQAYCRGYLARKAMAQRRIQELAVRCIQRNVKAFLAVRDWPWWRLLVRVTPLLNVHRTEEQLKAAHDELHLLRAKLEKIENDRNDLKTENQKLEIKLSEMAVDLAEERSTANLATERLEAETAERLRLEKDLTEQQAKVKKLQESAEKLEMELIYASSDMNGFSDDEDNEQDDDGGANSAYKLKYERAARELEFTKRRLQTQHEHDLEQLVGLKKQLEKKLSDAYEEVEEQRQIVCQWKRKAQKMTNEMNDLRMLLEEQNARNNLLEKKQRKFDSECQSLQDVARQERQAKERLSREKDVLIAEKFTLEQSLADLRLEFELREEKLSSVQRELEELTFGGGTEEEIAQLRRSKNELDRRTKEQEEELDEMAGQIQLLEQSKLRLEMSLETMRKETRREAQQRDEELEEARSNAYKKIKALECQLETEHEERTLLLREKHELERRLSAMEDQERADRQAEELANQKLRRDIRKYKALLKDAQTQLDRFKSDAPGKNLIRQLRNQLEDAESARTLAMKARQTAEAELNEVQAMFEESNRARHEAEDKANTAQRDRNELQSQVEENEEELAELMKKYSAAVKQLNAEQITVSEYEFKLSELELERNNLKEQVAELQQRLENVENMADPSAAMLSKRLELRTKELESRFELEQATRARLEVQVNRHKDGLEKLQNELTQCKMREMQAQDALKKSQKCLRELREEFNVISVREQEFVARRKDLEKKLEQVEAEANALRNDLRLALQRIADLQRAMEEGDDDEDLSESEDSRSSLASFSDLEDHLNARSRHSVGKSTRQNTGSNSTSITSNILCEKSDQNPRFHV